MKASIQHRLSTEGWLGAARQGYTDRWICVLTKPVSLGNSITSLATLVCSSSKKHKHPCTTFKLQVSIPVFGMLFLILNQRLYDCVLACVCGGTFVCLAQSSFQLHLYLTTPSVQQCCHSSSPLPPYTSAFCCTTPPHNSQSSLTGAQEWF